VEVKVCLDTCALSALMAEDQGERTSLTLEILEEADRIFVPSIVLGESFFGFARGNRESTNRRHLREILEQPGVAIVAIDAEVAERYAQIIVHLRKVGKPIPQNDIWIAAAAINLGAALLTFDKHFRHVPGLFIIPET
jgi:tRNA(fMet)-specific endonuclease VapC